MRALGKTAAIQLALLAGFERIASACPFCGGKGASGLFENLLLVAGLWFGARALTRAMQRHRLPERPPEPEAADSSTLDSARSPFTPCDSRLTAVPVLS